MRLLVLWYQSALAFALNSQVVMDSPLPNKWKLQVSSAWDVRSRTVRVLTGP
jgi:hypothetical protein